MKAMESKASQELSRWKRERAILPPHSSDYHWWDRRIKAKEYQMNYYDAGASIKTNTAAVETIMEKYVVMTTSGFLKGSWAKEKDAINWIKQAIKNDRDSARRYLILEAVKEIGTKTPEIEIEEL